MTPKRAREEATLRNRGALGGCGNFGYHTPMKSASSKTVLAAALLLPALATSAELAAKVETFTDDASGLLSWKAQHPGFSLQFIQLLPNYIRAIYSARGLPDDVVELMAGYCVFGTIIKNESDQPLSYRVADWQYVTADGQKHPIKTKSEWLKEWQERGVAFRWSLLPDTQTFAPGDWSQGFTTLPLPPDTLVTLHYNWILQGNRYEGTFENLRCAPAEAPAR